jgi:hypothetical protein
MSMSPRISPTRLLTNAYWPECGTTRTKPVRSNNDSVSTDSSDKVPIVPTGLCRQNKNLLKTLDSLTAVLGIEDDVRKNNKSGSNTDRVQGTEYNISSEVLAKIAEVEIVRNGPTDPGAVEVKLARILEQAKKVANTPNMGTDTELRLRRMFMDVLAELRPDEAVSFYDIENIRRLFKTTTFVYITESKALDDLSGGYLLRASLRGDVGKSIRTFLYEFENHFGHKYVALVIEEHMANFDGDIVTAGSNVAFQILPKSKAMPCPTRGWEYLATILLFLFTLASCVTLGLTVNVSSISHETIVVVSRYVWFDVCVIFGVFFFLVVFKL